MRLSYLVKIQPVPLIKIQPAPTKNPKTGEKLDIAATTVPKFSAGATFKAAVAKKVK